MKNKNGSAYIFVILILMISSLFLNSTFDIIKINDEKKHSENNNLYYMAESGIDKFSDIANKILELSVKQAEETNQPESQIFHENMQKFLGNEKILMKIKNAPRDYEIEINFERENDFDYKIKSCATDTINKNKVEMIGKIKRDGEKFSSVSYVL